ncbi:hypothetical protein LOAG_11600, partial [Loa loa]
KVETRTSYKNEIVLINELEISRGLWKLAKIKEIKREGNEDVRNAMIEMLHGNFSTD